MTRDMDLIREILRIIEERPDGSRDLNVSVPGRSPDAMRLHLHLMEDAGLIEGLTITSSSMIVMRLTYAGYDFIEATRKDTIWNKAKDIAISKTGGLSLTALTEALKIAVATAVGG